MPYWEQAKQLKKTCTNPEQSLVSESLWMANIMHRRVSIRGKNDGISPDKVEMLQACQPKNKRRFTLMATLMECCTLSAYQKMIWTVQGQFVENGPNKVLKVNDGTCVQQNGEQKSENSWGCCDTAMHGYVAELAVRRKKHLLQSAVGFYIMHPSFLKCTSCDFPFLCSSKRHLPISIIKQAVADKSNAVILQA